MMIITLSMHLDCPHPRDEFKQGKESFNLPFSQQRGKFNSSLACYSLPHPLLLLLLVFHSSPTLLADTINWWQRAGGDSESDSEEDADESCGRARSNRQIFIGVGVQSSSRDGQRSYSAVAVERGRGFGIE